MVIVILDNFHAVALDTKNTENEVLHGLGVGGLQWLPSPLSASVEQGL